MMKRILLIVLVTAAGFAHPQPCKCKFPRAKYTDNYSDKKYIYKRLYGQIINFNGRPIPNIRVEVYPAESSEESKQTALASCKTNKQGLFCFNNLAKGTYELRLIDDEPRSNGPFENIVLTVTVDPKNRKSTKRPLRTYLTLRI